MASQPGTGSGSGAGPDRPLLLVVCRANICRSPLVAHELVQRIEQLDPDSGWRVLSAGTAAQTGEHQCPRSAKACGGARTPHRARQLSADLVRSATLVLTASLAERAAVAQLDLGARERTFTLREAAALADVLAAQEVTVSGGPDALVAALHDVRGLEPSLTAHRRRHREVGPLDVPDGHQGQARSHRTVLSEVRRSTERLAPLLARHGRPA
jgi:protein-tyrosine phosphatase